MYKKPCILLLLWEYMAISSSNWSASYTSCLTSSNQLFTFGSGTSFSPLHPAVCWKSSVWFQAFSAAAHRCFYERSLSTLLKNLSSINWKKKVGNALATASAMIDVCAQTNKGTKQLEKYTLYARYCRLQEEKEEPLEKCSMLQNAIAQK